MQEFFMDYGLWLLIALLIVIGVIFLLAGRKGSADLPPVEAPAAERRETAQAAAAAPVVEPVAPVAAEPIATAAPEVSVPVSAPSTASVPASPAVTTVTGEGDNLLKMKGIGPKLNQLLIELGVTRYAQIASWSDADIAAIDARLGNFKGRPVRDQWVDQARYLAAGDTAGFEAKYGRL